MTETKKCSKCEDDQFGLDNVARHDHHIRLRHLFLLDYLKTHPCEGCGEKDPVVLDLHHIDPTTKIGGVSPMICQGKPMKLIKEEIAKCRVLCANCHRRHTAEQSGWYRLIRQEMDEYRKEIGR